MRKCLSVGIFGVRGRADDVDWLTDSNTHVSPRKGNVIVIHSIMHIIHVLESWTLHLYAALSQTPLYLSTRARN